MSTCLVFFHGCGHHRYLHSFPTRRSSDLLAVVLDDRVGRADHVGVVARAARERSEEHTSELQSLAYLVCCLLLEKKKNVGHPNTRQAALHFTALTQIWKVCCPVGTRHPKY